MPSNNLTGYYRCRSVLKTVGFISCGLHTAAYNNNRFKIVVKQKLLRKILCLLLYVVIRRG